LLPACILAQVEAKWHANYHLLRCWLDSGSGTLQQLMQQQWQQQGDQAAPLAASAAHSISSSDSESDTEGDSSTAPASVAALIESNIMQQQQLQQQQQHQLQQQQLPSELHEAAAWLHRQVELYGKLKLTPVKVTMLRRLGEAWQSINASSTRYGMLCFFCHCGCCSLMLPVV
jgi:inactivated superfamily I helicase